MPSPQEAAAALMGLDPVQTAVPLASEEYPGAVQSMSAALQFPNNLAQQAFEASEQLRNTGQYNPAPVVQAASMLMGGGAPAAEAGAAGIFGGRLAQGANIPKLNLARMMEVRGADPAEIWQKTGWSRGTTGPNSKWRFEIPDNISAFNPDIAGRSTVVANALHHPALFQAYPDLERIPLNWSLSNDYKGMHMPAIGTDPESITLNQWQPLEQKHSTILHELQHAVQDREHFSSGINSDWYKKRVQLNAEKYGYPEGMPKENVQKWLDVMATLGYQSHPGEIEARNVQSRIPYNYIERASIPPNETAENAGVIPPELLKYLGR